SERLTAYELGYRGQVLEKLSIDVSAFHNRYQGLASLEIGTPFFDPAGSKSVLPIVNENLTHGISQGIETLLTFSPFAYWRLSESHSSVNLDLTAAGRDLNRGRFLEGSTPRHQFGLRSFLDLPANVQLDGQFRHLTAITKLPSIVSGTGLPGYSEMDARLA